MIHFRSALNILALGTIVVGTMTGCATKKFVRTQVDTVGQRVETISQSLESTQQATKENQARAEAVKRYLYEAHQVPLHKMNVISYGAAKPLSPNNTKQGRAQNRRVVIRILA